MRLHATFLLENVSDYKDEQKNIVYHSLVTTQKKWSSKLNREIEDVVSISIPQKFGWLSAELKKHIGKEIIVAVRERVFNDKFSGYALDSDQFSVNE
ncbi:hypothetical protein [Acinetobacter baumannii]|uniref:hypothetical protein n=1 Tax=Acinetobacter baumannii TaxID=470 RepID=UPI0034CD6F3C